MNYFIDCLTKKYACFSGRARRQEYWLFVLFNIIKASINGVASAVLTVLAASFEDTDVCELAVLADELPDVLFEVHAASEHIRNAEIITAIVFFNILKTSLKF